MDLSYGTVYDNDDSYIESQSFIKKADFNKEYGISQTFSFGWLFSIRNMILSIIFLIILISIIYHKTTSRKDDVTIVDTSSMSYIVSTSYGIHDSERFPYPWLENATLVENYKENLFKLVEPISGCKYYYDISKINDPSFSLTGSSEDGSFTFKPTATGQYQLIVDERCGKKLTQSYERTLWSKYVRRELSSLSDEDREDFLDAFATLWAVKTPEGKKLYGDNYKSLYHFAVIHNDAGANPVCDQFHTGSGFINNHIYLGSYLEQVMRLVDPSVSLHYMEYGKYFSSDDYAKHHSNQLDGGSWSEIFTEKYFGSNDPYTGKIIDGRWSDFTIPYLTDEFLESEDISPTSTFFSNEEVRWLELTSAHMKNPYGLLRSPWNFSPANYTIRYNNVNLFNDFTTTIDAITNYYNGVDCDDYEFFIGEQIVGQPLVSLLSDVEDEVHGKIHFTIGGAGGNKCYETNDYLRETYNFEWQDIVTISQSSQRFFKTVLGAKPAWNDFRNGLYPLNCTKDPWQDGILTTTAEPGEIGGPSCLCSNVFLENKPELLKLINSYFIDWIGFNENDDPQLYTVEKITSLSFAEQVDIMNHLCGRFQFEGDLAGSGAATDPIFWVVHGGVERIMQKIYFENVLTDYIYDEPKSTCSGHLPTGTKDWLKGYKLEDESISTELLTNSELAEYLNPLSNLYRDQIDFVYDHSDWGSLCNGDVSSWFKK